jgi:hypothetical protein
MNSLNRISYNIAEIVGKPNDTSVILRIQDLIIYYRALFLRRTIENHTHISSHFIQSLTEEMIPVDTSGIANLTNKLIYRTKNIIPKAIRLVNNELFTYVGGVDNTTPFYEVNERTLSLIQYDKFSSKMPRYFIRENYIYVFNTQPKQLRLKGVFEDPREINGYDADALFPMSDDMTSLIINTIVKEEFRIDKSITEEVK